MSTRRRPVHHRPGWIKGVDRRLKRMQRPEFEALLWSLAPRTASTESRERIAAHDAIMRAFDAATGRQPHQRQQPEAEVRQAAEVIRQYAMAVNCDTPAVQAGRRAELKAALDSLPPGWYRDHNVYERKAG